MTSALDGSGWWTSRPGRLYPQERPDTHFTEGWVGPRATTGIRSPDLPARSESLYRLHYPAPLLTCRSVLKKGQTYWNSRPQVSSFRRRCKDLLQNVCILWPKSRSQWPCGLRRKSAAVCLLRLWVRIPPGAWLSVVSVVCCQVEVSVTDWSLVQRSPTDSGVSLCVI